MSEPPLPLPPAIHRFLVELLRVRWSGKDPRPQIDALPAAMPEGAVQRLASGGPFGWMIDARVDRIAGRIALEALEDDRMSGPNHYRVWDDGTVEPLPNERIAFSHPKDASPEQIEAVRQDYYAHNRAVQEQLKERGFIG